MSNPKDPWYLPKPAAINFSGGRTSGRMLRGYLDAHGGTLPPGVRVCFENTGKEHEQTLAFVQRCSDEWRVPIVWLEYTRDGDKHSLRVVDFATARRNGEPFEELLGKLRDYRAGKDKPPVLPNPVQRFCTSELKIRTLRRYVNSLGIDHHDLTVAVGFRADEPRRVSRLRARVDAGDMENGDPVFPLHTAGITEADVLSFWRAQPFDLELESHQGNCDLCFLKNTNKLLDLMRRDPERAKWWANLEQETGQRFRRDRPGYAALLERAQQPGLFGWDEPDGEPCYCTD